jgi:hypothetical protein
VFEKPNAIPIMLWSLQYYFGIIHRKCAAGIISLLLYFGLTCLGLGAKNTQPSNHGVLWDFEDRKIIDKGDVCLHKTTQSSWTVPGISFPLHPMFVHVII